MECLHRIDNYRNKKIKNCKTRNNNNGRLQRVVAEQEKAYGTIIGNPDFVALARACGADGVVLDATSDMEAILEQAFTPANKPFLIDCRLHPELQVPISKGNDDFIPMNRT